MKSFPVVRLEEVCQIVAGQHIPARLYNQKGRGVAYLTGPSDFRDSYPEVTKWTESPKVHSRPGDVLLTVKGAGVGKCNLGIDAAIGRQLMALRSDPERLDYLYLYLFVKSRFAEIASLARGATVPGIGKRELAGLQIPLPLLRDQQNIVARCSCYLERSKKSKEALDAIPGLLDRYRQSVLAAACSGRLTADWRKAHPDVEPASVLLERIRVERRRRWEEDQLAQMKAKGKTPKNDKWKAKYQEPEPVDTTGLPELPEGWCWARLNSIADVRLGRQRSPQNHFGPKMCKYLRAANVSWSGLDLSDVKQMHFSANEVKVFRLQPGDLLIGEASGSRGEVGKPVLWRGELNECCFQNTLLRVRPIGHMSEFLLVHFLKDAISGAFGRASRGVNLHHLGRAALDRWLVRVPPMKEQNAIVALVDELEHKHGILREGLGDAGGSLTRLTQSVLGRCFGGM